MVDGPYTLDPRWRSLDELIDAHGGAGALRLDLGCGYVKPEGTIGIDDLSAQPDRVPEGGSAPDLYMDLNRDPLPFSDSSVEEIVSSHFIEHSNLPHVLPECRRVLKPGGTFHFVVPYANSAEGMYPGHLTFLTERWFHESPLFNELFEIVDERFDPSPEYEKLPRAVRRLLPFDLARRFLFNVCNQMHIICRPRPQGPAGGQGPAQGVTTAPSYSADGMTTRRGGGVPLAEPAVLAAPARADVLDLPAVGARTGAPFTQYWRERLRQAIDGDRYAGVPISKLPEDLRVYEHLIWDQRPECVIEIGIGLGGSGLWFRDRLRALGSYGDPFEPKVIGIEIEPAAALERLAHADHAYADQITIIEGDVRDSELSERVAREVGAASCLVVEDGAHEYETTMAALDGFHRFVPKGGFFVVEDGVVDREELRLQADWPRGVLPAIEDWLAGEAGAEFEVHRELELYGITSHPGGFLQRRGRVP